MSITNFPMPQNISLSDDDLNAAIVQFIHTFTGYAADGHIRAAGNNRVPLPTDNNFAIFQIINHERHGTSVTTFTVEDEDEEGTLKEIETVTVDVQISCYGDIGGNAYRKAQAIETAAHGYSGCRFFAQYNIGCDYATTPRQLMVEDSERQYVERWVVTLTISYNTALSMEVPYIDTANIQLKNVDVEYPPTD